MFLVFVVMLILISQKNLKLCWFIPSSCHHTTRSMPQKVYLKNFSRQHMEIILLGSFARLCGTLVLQHLVTTATEKENLMNAWLISFLCQQLMKMVELSARVLDAVWSTHNLLEGTRNTALISHLILNMIQTAN